MLLTKVLAKLAICGCGFSHASPVSRAVNVLKGKVHTGAAYTKNTPSWDDESLFDKTKEKTEFRQYDDACDRVKEFYREQHGMHLEKS